MTMTKIALATLIVAGSLSAGNAFAAKPADGGFSPDGAEQKQECRFVGELGGYVCAFDKPTASLSEPTGPGTGAGPGKVTISFNPAGNPGVVQKAP
jgi:hypothetical protein